ncbi:hypothetical protein SSCG_00639 [Streptomyces clavuligerus]|nr:hypothetical protein SSCG_00639 [Streptomyces clavuligerus]
MRPGALALDRQDLLGGEDLLPLGGEVGAGRVVQTAEARPGRLGELEAAVVAVAGVDGPVAAGLALGDLVPGRDGGGCGGRGGEQTGGQAGRDGEGGATVSARGLREGAVTLIVGTPGDCGAGAGRDLSPMVRLFLAIL